VVLRVRGSTGSLGKLTLQRDCGVSWRYKAISLIENCVGPPTGSVSAIEMVCQVSDHFMEEHC
jgi:hypothetical protein